MYHFCFNNLDETVTEKQRGSYIPHWAGKINTHTSCERRSEFNRWNMTCHFLLHVTNHDLTTYLSHRHLDSRSSQNQNLSPSFPYKHTCLYLLASINGYKALRVCLIWMWILSFSIRKILQKNISLNFYCNLEWIGYFLPFSGLKL